MSFFDSISNLAGPIGTIAGGLIGGPGGAAIGGGIGSAASRLLGGGGGGSSISAGDIQSQQEDMVDKLLGYETPGSRFLEDYAMNVFMDAGDPYSKNKNAQNMFGIISDAVQSENLDPFSAQQFLASKLQPNSDFYSTDDFASLLNAEVGKNKQNQILNDAFITNFYRAPTAKETRYYNNLANSVGANKSTTQLTSFYNSRLANTLEADAKGPLNDYERQIQATMGTAIRDAEGYKTGTYNVFGLPIKRNNSSALIG